MNSSGVIVVIKPDQLLPAAFRQVLLADCPHGFSYSVAEGNNTLESGFFDTKGEKPEEVIKTLDEMNTKFQAKKLVLFFNRMEDPPEICQQPIPILTSKAGSLLINAFVDGEFKKYEADQEFDPGTAFVMRFFGDEVARKYAECGSNLDKLFKELEREDYRTTLWPHMEPRGCVILHDIRGNVLTLSRSNGKEHGSFDWGFASNHLGYKEVKVEEPQEEIMPEGLNFMEKRKWLADHKAAATKPKEVATAKAADTSKSSVEKHPEGGTEVKLDAKLKAVLDGRIVRPDQSLQDRILKDWYKVHDKDGCPQNYKHGRPGIPFERLKVDSSIRKFLEASGLFVTGVSAKDTQPHHVEPSQALPVATGLTPQQIAGAVSIHKKATYVVDTAQFEANEKDNPDFFERTKIPLEEFIRMSAKDKQALRELVGAPEIERSLIVELVKRDSALIKSGTVTTTTKDEKVEEPPKELSFMEQRRQAALAKSKVA